MTRSLLAAVLLLILAVFSVAYLTPAHAAPVVGTVILRHPCVLIADLEADTHSRAVEAGRNGDEVFLAFRAPDGSTTYAVTVDAEVACIVWSDAVTGVGA